MYYAGMAGGKRCRAADTPMERRASDRWILLPDHALL